MAATIQACFCRGWFRTITLALRKRYLLLLLPCLTLYWYTTLPDTPAAIPPSTPSNKATMQKVQYGPLTAIVKNAAKKHTATIIFSCFFSPCYVVSSLIELAVTG